MELFLTEISKGKFSIYKYSLKGYIPIFLTFPFADNLSLKAVYSFLPRDSANDVTALVFVINFNYYMRLSEPPVSIEVSHIHPKSNKFLLL